MTEALKQEWQARVEETFEALKWADKDIQERACKSVQKEFSSEEAAAKLMGLFVAEADRMKAAFFVPPSQSKVAEAKVEPAKIEDAAVKAAAVPKASPGFVKRLGIGRAYPKQDVVRPVLKVVEQREPEPEPEPEAPEPTFAELSGVEVLDPRDMMGRPRLVTPGDAAQKPIVALNEINKKHSVILNLGGKCVVMEWAQSQIDPKWEEPSYQSFSSFRERYMNKYVEVIDVIGKQKKIDAQPVASWWLGQPGRRQYEGLDLVPGAPMVLPGRRLNLWRGWGVEPKEGDWSKLRDHIRVVIGGEERRSWEYIVRWIAWKFQNAGLPTEVALNLKGKKGVGKGALMYPILVVFGPHGLEIHNPQHLTGKHNKHLQNRLLLCADEAIWAGDKQAERVLKGMVTERTLTIEPKGIDAFNWPNRLGIIQSTNDRWVVPARWDERRYAVFEVNPVHMQKKEYFGPLFAEIDGGGAAAMLYDLLKMDLDGWHPRYDIPQTQALLEQKVQSLDGLEQWWLAKLSSGETPTPSMKNPRWILSRNLYEEATAHNARTKYVTETEFGNFLRGLGCEHKSNGKAWGWVFPPLPEARRSWEIRMNGTYEWLRPAIAEWNEGTKHQ